MQVVWSIIGNRALLRCISPQALYPTRLVTYCCRCCCYRWFCHCYCRQLLLTYSRHTSRFEALQAEQVHLHQHSCVHFTPFYFITFIFWRCYHNCYCCCSHYCYCWLYHCCCCGFTCLPALLLLSRRVPHFELLQAEQVRLQQHSCVHFTPFYFITLSSESYSNRQERAEAIV